MTEVNAPQPDRKPRVFGKRGQSLLRSRGTTATFGRRSRLPALSISLQRERLWDIYSGLRILLEEPSLSSHDSPLEFHDGPMPRLQVGSATVIWVDPQTGGYVAKETSSTTEHTFKTVDQDRLTEFALAQLAREGGELSPSACLQAVSCLTGKTMAELEYFFMLATLRRCRGNRTHTAKMLGISLRTLRNRLRELRMKSGETAGGRLE